MTDQANIDRGSTFASELEADKAHREKARTAKPLRRLAPFVLAYPGLLAAFAVFLFLASALTLTLPAAFRLVVDCGFGGASDSAACTNFTLGTDLSAYFVGGIIVALLLGMVSALRYYFISRLGERVIADIRKTVYDHLLNLSPTFYAQTRTGEVLSRLTTDTTLIQTVIGSSISIALRTTATTSGALILMVIVSWKLSLLVLALGPLIILPVMAFGRRIQRLSRSSQDSLANASARASESLRAIETVQAFTREPEERANFAGAVEQTYDVALRRIRVRASMTAIIFSFILAGLIAVLWFGAVQVKGGAITPGAMTQFVMYAFVAISGVSMLTETYAEVMRAAGATERLMEILAATPDIKAPSNPRQLPKPIRGRIAFESVDFYYPARPEAAALKGVSFQVEPGQTVALVGPSGAGKSTMFQLLLRLYDPQAGSVQVDNIDIRELDPSALREGLSIVQQNAPLFGGSAAENIRFGRSNARDEDIIAAAKAANAHDFIMALPDGYDTQLGEAATTLSGGQRQRLAIARAIQDAFERLSADRTTIVIAHRLATVLKADKIAVMEDGHIVDQGTHAELLERGGLYARFVELQFGMQT
jgi:ATP-binding cassette subfamily B protein